MVHVENRLRKIDIMETVTIKDIAKICGVGVATVSRALNNHPDINAATKQKIMDVVKQYNFVPNNSARNLKRTASKTIAVLAKGMENPFFTSMISIMGDEIHKQHYSMELRHVDEKTDEVEVAIELAKEKKLQGIIFLGGLTTHSSQKLQNIGVPFVLSTISMSEDSEGYYSSVAVDDIAESYKVTNYLIQKGHRRIVFMGASKEDTSIGNLRLEGYKRALKSNGLEIDESLIWHSTDIEHTFTHKNGYIMVKDNIQRSGDFTAVFAIADTMALGAIRAFSEEGMSVPEDVSIMGFDGLNLGNYSIPSLTTVRQPFENMAVETTKILFEVIKEDAVHRNVVMEAQIVERESVRDIN